MGPPTNTRHAQRLPATYSCRLAETPGSPRSTHTDTDTAMELESLSMAPRGPDVCHVALRASAPEDLVEKVARGVAAAATKILESLTQAPPVDEKSRPPVDKSTDATIQECFLRRRATTLHPRPLDRLPPTEYPHLKDLDNGHQYHKKTSGRPGRR